jgi:hypothetical protein
MYMLGSEIQGVGNRKLFFGRTGGVELRARSLLGEMITGTINILIYLYSACFKVDFTVNLFPG